MTASENPEPNTQRPERGPRRASRGRLRVRAHSLASKIVAFVFATALVASLAVTWVSGRSIQNFLRAKIDQRLPAVLGSVQERLSLWYDQRELDVRTFAASDTLRRNLDPARQGAQTREIEQYLGYVVKSFAQYEALFVLRPQDQPLLWAGAPLEIPEPIVGELASAEGVGPAFGSGGERYQIASAPILDGANRRLASLHAVIDVRTPQAEIQRDGLSERGRISVVSGAGVVLMQTRSDEPQQRYSRSLPFPGAQAAVEVYDADDGERVVGSAVRFGRFDWTIAVEEPAAELFEPAFDIVWKVLAGNVGIVLGCSLIALQIARSIVRPIHALSQAAERVANGEADVTFTASGNDEIGVLGRTFNEMLARLDRNRIELERNRVEIEHKNQKLLSQNQELQRVNEVFHQLSITDDLTRLHNHRFFQDHLPREMSRATRTGEPLSLILIDIDDFKKLNDAHGHSVGDAVLQKSAAVMNDVVREMDLLARYGGEEFALLASQTSLEGALALAEKVRAAVSQIRFPIVTLEGKTELSITVSIGVAEFDGDQKALFNAADRALYRAKAQGKDCVVLAECDESMPA